MMNHLFTCTHRNYVYDLISGSSKNDLYQDSDSVQFDEACREQDVVDRIETPVALKNWLKNFDDETIDTYSGGEKNTFYNNPAFVRFLLNLCKTFVLWSGVNAQFFKADVNANTSANVQSHFKDVKKDLKDKIPCRVGEFIGEHIEMIDGMVLDASQEYVEFVDAAGGLAQFRECITSLNLNESETDLNETPSLDEFAENFTNEKNMNNADNSNIGDSKTNDQLQSTSNNAEIAEHSDSSDERSASGDEENSNESESETSSQLPTESSNSSHTQQLKPNSKEINKKKSSLSSDLNENDKWSKKTVAKETFSTNAFFKSNVI